MAKAREPRFSQPIILSQDLKGPMDVLKERMNHFEKDVTNSKKLENHEQLSCCFGPSMLERLVIEEIAGFTIKKNSQCIQKFLQLDSI